MSGFLAKLFRGREEPSKNRKHKNHLPSQKPAALLRIEEMEKFIESLEAGLNQQFQKHLEND